MWLQRALPEPRSLLRASLTLQCCRCCELVHSLRGPLHTGVGMLELDTFACSDMCQRSDKSRACRPASTTSVTLRATLARPATSATVHQLLSKCCMWQASYCCCHAERLFCCADFGASMVGLSCLLASTFAIRVMTRAPVLCRGSTWSQLCPQAMQLAASEICSLIKTSSLSCQAHLQQNTPMS